MGLVAATAGQAIFDCLQLEPAARFSEAIEAEELTVVRATGGATMPRAQRSDRRASAPAGCWSSTPTRRARDSCSISASGPRCPMCWASARCSGPKRASSRPSWRTSRSGPQFDLYAAKRQLGPSILPLGPVPADATEVEIRVVGRNEQSQGWDAELDYFRWEPSILGPGTAEGVWAQVVGTHDCDYRRAGLGRRPTPADTSSGFSRAI